MKACRTSCVLVLLLLVWAQPAGAWSWSTLWLRADAQAMRSLANDKPTDAARLFTQPEWQAYAHMRAGEYARAVAALEGIDTPLAHYNRGNALVHLGKYQHAIAAFSAALAIDPAHEDAKANKQVVEDFLKQNPPPNESPSSAPNASDASDDSSESDASGDANPSDKTNETNAPDTRWQDDANASSQPNQADESDESDESDAADDADPSRQDTESNTAPAPEQTIAPDKLAQGFAQQNQSHPDSAPKNIIDAVVDDPGGLLRQKFLRDYLRRQQQESQDVNP